MLTVGPLALELNPVVMATAVSKYALPELTYKFLVNGTVTLALVYVTAEGAANAPPAPDDTIVDDPDVTPTGYVSPLSLATLPLMANVVLELK